MRDMTQTQVGEIWTLTYGKFRGVVVCVWADESEEDLRLVPFSTSSDQVAFATDRDVLIPAKHWGGSGVAIAHAWMARTVSRSELLQRVGEVSDDALSAIRSAEMYGIAPESETAYKEWRGRPIVEIGDPRVSQMRVLLEKWHAAQYWARLFRTGVTYAARDVRPKSARVVAERFEARENEDVAEQLVPIEPPLVDTAANSNLSLAA